MNKTLNHKAPQDEQEEEEEEVDDMENLELQMGVLEANVEELTRTVQLMH